jgi:hypothetical protein
MPQEPINIDNHKLIWIAISEFYLDKELQETDFQVIAKIIIKSKFNFEEIRAIDKYEIFPVLKYNLLQVAGEWAGFEEDWLIENITLSLQRKSKFRRVRIEISYWFFQWMYKDYWKNLEKAYIQAKNKIST